MREEWKLEINWKEKVVFVLPERAGLAYVGGITGSHGRLRISTKILAAGFYCVHIGDGAYECNAELHLKTA